MYSRKKAGKYIKQFNHVFAVDFPVCRNTITDYKVTPQTACVKTIQNILVEIPPIIHYTKKILNKQSEATLFGRKGTHQVKEVIDFIESELGNGKAKLYGNPKKQSTQELESYLTIMQHIMRQSHNGIRNTGEDFFSLSS